VINRISQPADVTLLVVILHDANCLPKLLKSWRRIGVPGSTILPSAGSYLAESWVKRTGLTSFLSLFDQSKLQQRTLLSLIDDPEILEFAIAEADRVVKGFDHPHSGILFTIPIGKVLGLKKWNEIEGEDQPAPEQEAEDSAHSRLMQWFEEDVKDRYGEDALQDWSKQKNMAVSEILPLLTIRPTIVRVDTSLFDVVTELQNNPGMPAACVINKEERLVGVIPLKGLADVMMAPVMPEAYIHDSESYETALRFADVNQLPVAAAIMSDPVYVIESETLEQTYQRMREWNLSGLPVLDKLYRVKGFITMLGLMAACFPARKDTKDQFLTGSE
jgi:CBS domain-containing protein